MPDTYTPQLGLTKPQVGASTNTWGTKENADADILDLLFDPTAGHPHTGLTGTGPKLAPLSHTGVVTTNVGLLTAISDTLHAVRVIAAGAGVAVANGDGVSANPTISLDPHSLTAETSIADGDEVPLADVSAANVPRKATRTNLLKGALLTGPREVFVDLGSGSGAVAVDVSVANWYRRQITGVWSVAPSGIPASGAFGFILEIVNGGSAAVTYPSGTKWAAGNPPTLTVSGTDILVFLSRDAGTTYRAVAVSLDSR